ncbi:hypothetical protein SH661x_003072 [Planctomicrobium sp. SH661]|uniref:hypothetical protein n=1 Tax=Planctomicrobium sp. SH661 TaxID=3448124 RepID=UPI003F5B2530
MQRREFLKLGACSTAAVAGVATTTKAMAASEGVSTSCPTAGPPPGVASNYSAEQQRKRLQNIKIGNDSIRNCMRKHLVTNYLSGQCCYNLGEYPCVKPWNPDEYDEQELDRLKAQGIQLIQVFDEWSDARRLHGGDKFTALNPEGFHRFVSMVHKRGMKILAYCSSGYFDMHDPNLKPEWMRPGDGCYVGWFELGRCSPASPDWRAYLLPKMQFILDEYGVDGIYNDWGYVPNAMRGPNAPQAADAIEAFQETANFDGAATDLLALMYDEVKRRGGILKLHADFANQPETAGLKVYDYLWVGENVNDANKLRDLVKDHPPYVVPCIDTMFAKIASDDEPFLLSIPYLQFPILPGGRPFTGERAMVPGFNYLSPNDLWMKRCRAAWEYHQAHPNGPHVYGSWDEVPPNPRSQETHAKWLKRYQQITEDGSWAWLDIRESNLFSASLPGDVVASAFANQEFYMVLANYGEQKAEVALAETYLPIDADTGASKTWTLAPRSLQILRRVNVS